MHFKIGIIGLGRQTIEEHIPAINLIDNVTIEAICDIDEQRVDEARKYLSANCKPSEYLSYQEMFDETELNFVVVSLPHDQYLNCIKRAAERQIHILKEKPFARTPEEAEIIFSLIEKYNIKVMTACQRRYHPLYLEFQENMRLLGEIKWIEARYTIPSKKPNAGWRSQKKTAGGGVMLDMGYHILDIIMWFFDPLNQVYALTLNHRPHVYQVEDTAFIKFKTNKYKNPEQIIDGSIFISCIYPEKNDELTIIGENGTAKLSPKKFTYWDNSQNIIINKVSKSSDDWLEASKEQILEFMDAILSPDWKSFFGNPHFQYRNHVPLIKALYESSEVHNPVDVKQNL